MITCPKCGKDNQDHYKFCLGCGAELPRDAQPKPFAPNTPNQGVKAAPAAAPAPMAPPPQVAVPGGYALGGAMAPTVAQPAVPSPAFRPPQASAPGPVGALGGGALGGAPQAPAPYAPPAFVPPAAQPPIAPPPAPPIAAAPIAAPNPAASPTGSTVTCPQCGHINGPSNVFCGSCGFRLGGQPGISRPPPPMAGNDVGGAVVLTALRADGTEAGTYALPGGTVTVGRDSGGIFAGDSYLSPRHATFRQTGPGRLTVRDESSLNGVYKKLQRDVPVELKPNDVFRIGQEIIRFEPLTPQPPSPDGVERLGAPSKGYVGRIALIIGRDATGNAFPVPEAGVHLGRERGDVLFPEDGYVSGLHCRLAWEGGRGVLTDLGSSNGTFIRIREETDLRSGDVLLMGQQLFRINM